MVLVVLGLVDSSPCILTKNQLGKAHDKDPEWRPTALFERAELEMLISDEQIPRDRRVLYALEGVAGLRHGEAAGSRRRHIDTTREPLGCILVATSHNKGRTKTDQPRRVPIHPTLAAILAEWKLGGWAERVGRHLEPDDLVVPLAPDERQPRTP